MRFLWNAKPWSKPCTMAYIVKRLCSKVAAIWGMLCHMLRHQIFAQYMIKFTSVADILGREVVKRLLFISFPKPAKFEALQTN
jgi:uncharacterized membrane protein